MLRSLARFGVQQRAALSACAAQSDRVRQLSQSHPVLFYALATGGGTSEQRHEALCRVERGCSLRSVCDVMGVAYGLRRIGPDALQQGYHECTLSEHKAQVLASRIGRIERGAQRSKALAAASYGVRIGGEDFGVWLADPRWAARLPAGDVEGLRPLALYAWICAGEGLGLVPEAAYRRAWSPRMGFAAAVSEARVFWDFLKFYLYFAKTPIKDTWARAGTVEGFEIVPLSSFEALIGEVRAMENCLYRYADRLRTNQSRLFSVGRHGCRLGTIELQRSRGELRIAEFKGPGNAPVGLDAMHAAHRWLDRQRCGSGRRPVDVGGEVPALLVSLLQAHAKARGLPTNFWRNPPTLEHFAAELRGLQGVQSTLLDRARIERVLNQIAEVERR